MKLWEYVLKYDKKADFIRKICEYEFIDRQWIKYKNPMPYELFIKRDYCPGSFECFSNTEFELPFDPYKNKNRKNECKHCENYPFDLTVEHYKNVKQMFGCFKKERQICSNCWDREIVDKNNHEQEDNNEYELYLKLKEKFENKVGDINELSK